MKSEVLRMDRVTCLDQGVTELNHFSLNIFAGEIMGLLPVNSVGIQPLLRLLRQNASIHYGYIYYREQLVNHWQRSDGSYNRVSVIEGRSGLADDLTVSDNVFVLRQGFRKRLIHRGVLRRQLEPFLREIGVQISADACARDLTTFERFVVELVKAVVAGNKLVILLDASTIVSDVELQKLHDILRHYAAKGISFLYISQHYEEIRQICDKAALMMNGQIVKMLHTKEAGPEVINRFASEMFEHMVRTQHEKHTPQGEQVPALEVRSLWHGAIEGLSFAISGGECVVIQDLDNRVMDDMLAVITEAERPQRGSLYISGKRYAAASRRDIAVIQKLAAKTMVFPELSYIDNLCFAMDHRLPRVWTLPQPKRSIRREYAAWLGDAVFDKSIDELTQMEKYDLIYARVLLQRPKVVFCVQPFMQADVEQRMHVWKLLEKLLDKKIAVVILAVNLADTLSLADRLIRVQNGRVQAIYARSEFGALPESTPWHHLWRDEESGL